MPYRSLLRQGQNGTDRPGIHHHGAIDKESARPALVKPRLPRSKLLRPMTAEYTDLHSLTSLGRVRVTHTAQCHNCPGHNIIGRYVFLFD